MPRGGPRPNSGRPKGTKNSGQRAQKALPPPTPMRPEVRRILREGDRLDALEVMEDNMAYFYNEAGRLVATIMAMPVGPDANPDQLEALRRLADANRFRLQAQDCAKEVVKYHHHQKGAKPYTEPPPDPNADQGGAPKVIEHNPELDATLGKFSAARRPAATNGHANGHANGGGLNGGGNGHG